jgi:hypothetical protein
VSVKHANDRYANPERLPGAFCLRDSQVDPIVWPLGSAEMFVAGGDQATISTWVLVRRW